MIYLSKNAEFREEVAEQTDFAERFMEALFSRIENGSESVSVENILDALYISEIQFVKAKVRNYNGELGALGKIPIPFLAYLHLKYGEPRD